MSQEPSGHEWGASGQCLKCGMTTRFFLVHGRACQGWFKESLQNPPVGSGLRVTAEGHIEVSAPPGEPFQWPLRHVPWTPLDSLSLRREMPVPAPYVAIDPGQKVETYIHTWPGYYPREHTEIEVWLL